MGNVIVGALLIVLVALAVRRIRRKRLIGGCGCGCEGCGMDCGANKEK